MFVLKGHKEPVQRIAFSPDGAALLSFGGYSRNEACLWDPATGALRWTSHPDFCFAAAVTPDGRFLLAGTAAASGTGTPHVRLREIGTGAETPVRLGERDGRALANLVFAPTGDRCLTPGAWDDATLYWWSYPGWEPLPAWPAAGDRFTSRAREVAFAPDGRTLVTLTWHGPVVYDHPAGTVRRTIPFALKQDMGLLAFHPDGRHLAAGSGPRVVVFDLGTGEAVAELRQAKKYFLQATFTPDGRSLLTVSNEATVKVWDVGGWQVVRELAWNVGGLRGLAVAPDGTRAAAGGAGKKIVVWDLDG